MSTAQTFHTTIQLLKTRLAALTLVTNLTAISQQKPGMLPMVTESRLGWAQALHRGGEVMTRFSKTKGQMPIMSQVTKISNGKVSQELAAVRGGKCVVKRQRLQHPTQRPRQPPTGPRPRQHRLQQQRQCLHQNPNQSPRQYRPARQHMTGPAPRQHLLQYHHPTRIASRRQGNHMVSSPPSVRCSAPAKMLEIVPFLA